MCIGGASGGGEENTKNVRELNAHLHNNACTFTHTDKRYLRTKERKIKSRVNALCCDIFL